MKMMTTSLVLAIILTMASAQTNETSSPATANHSISKDAIDLNKTINEVEKILDKYPELPRLDRSEILNILQNITEEDSEKLKDELTGVLDEEKKKMTDSQEQMTKENITRAESNRSVMVVLPFKPEDEDQSLEELFTRSPIVMMEEQNKTENSSVSTRKPELDSSQPPSGFSIIEKEDKSFNPPLRVIGYRYHSTTNSPSSSVGYTNFHDAEQVTMAFSTPQQEAKPASQWNHKETADNLNDVILAEDSRAGVAWQSKPFSQKFHVPDAMDNFSIEDAMFQNEQLGKAQETQTENMRDMQFSVQDAIYQNTPTKNPQFDISDIVFTTTTAATPSTTAPKMYVTTSDDFWNDVDMTTSKPTTTSTTTTKAPKKKKSKPKIRPVEKTTKKPTTEGIGNALDNLPPHMKLMLGSLGIENGMSLSETTEEILVPPPEIKPVEASVDPGSFLYFKPLSVKKHKTISDDMQQFLASFGLFDNNGRHQKSMETTTQSPTTVNDKYLESAPEIDTDFLSEDMKKTLQGLGLYDNPPQKQSQESKSKPKEHIAQQLLDELKKPSPVIFKPNDNTIQSDEEVKKLNTLLSTIKKLASLNDSQPVTPEFQREVLEQVKQLDNITISYKTSAAINEEIHKIMERNKGKFKIPIIMKETEINTLPLGVNPEFYEDVDSKNEVKRQQKNTTAELSDIMMDEDSKSAGDESSTTTEPANSADLEDAFGGGGIAPADADPADSLPPKRPNGLYFLLDWNTFFEVGTEDDKRRVNIRFQPKVGSSRNFLPVTIP